LKYTFLLHASLIPGDKFWTHCLHFEIAKGLVSIKPAIEKNDSNINNDHKDKIKIILSLDVLSLSRNQ